VLRSASVGGKDVRCEPLEERRARLEGLHAGADGDLLRFSEAFDNAEKLLAAALKLGLRASSRRSAVKTAAFREANRDRWGMFQR
jgi:hypothetical protein